MTHLLLGVIYLSFIGLGLPDSLLGAAWPAIYPELGLPVSYAGIISVIICLGTIFSSLQSDRLSKWLGTGPLTAVSTAFTAVALFGFSTCRSFWQLCLWAIPYGLGAGGVDASLNNYVALHYASRHMSWLHCMWGIGASVGPYLMGLAITGNGWAWGYRQISLIQIALTAILFLSLPLWKSSASGAAPASGERAKPVPIRTVLRLPGALPALITFFCYCALESTVSLWSASYLVLRRGLDADLAASFAGLFFLGITVGRGASGFLTAWLDDDKMIRLGRWIVAAGVVMLVLPFPALAPVSLLTIGLGCAPIYPCLTHATPVRFGADVSQAFIGVQMAIAYLGSMAMPPLFGLLAQGLGAGLMPLYLAVILAVMTWAHVALTSPGTTARSR